MREGKNGKEGGMGRKGRREGVWRGDWEKREGRRDGNEEDF